jgi:hypothetical protein
MKVAEHRRESDGSSRGIRFDLTVNVPVIVTLLLGFTSLVVAVVQGYYGHDARIARLEMASAALEKSEVVEKQNIMAGDLATLKETISTLNQNSEKTDKRLDRIEDKLDRVIEGRSKR